MLLRIDERPSGQLIQCRPIVISSYCDSEPQIILSGTLLIYLRLCSLVATVTLTIRNAYQFAGIVGLSKDSDIIVDISFDILSLEALFLVPRICALLSLVPFFGTLVITSTSKCVAFASANL